ncbi:SDR family oxidoreductase [Nocardia huaxiensis]|uniref:SDR family oxidoreductase n=1 Tax=Nocardia huaxiensis TaxID=2755382 RepID=A0A7D6ZG82_9NOCA|nr:SDR family oxidoreductase [Nocardia huaxiensis]QLY29587.1 SDR family oxidoreductase [Nocardia huaxiensis]
MALPKPAPDRTALVTGASSGIGRAIALELAGRGHQVCLVARREEKLAELAREIKAAGGRAEVLVTDLTDRAARAELPKRVADLGLSVDILVNNAGWSTLGPVVDSTPESELGMVEVDVMSVVDLCTRFAPGMVERGAGAILNVASTASFQPLPGQTGYGAAKAFVLSYSLSLKGELMGTGVKVTALCPGPVVTEFIDVAGFTEQEYKFMPPPMWKPAHKVAKAGVNGVARGRMVVIPGQLNRFVSYLAYYSPKRIVVPIVALGHPRLQSLRKSRRR